MSVLNCLYDSVSQILRKNVEKRAVLESLDIVMLAMDEICDGGIIIDADSSSVVSRVALRSDDIPLGEQTVAQVTNAIHSMFWWGGFICFGFYLVSHAHGIQVCAILVLVFDWLLLQQDHFCYDLLCH